MRGKPLHSNLMKMVPDVPEREVTDFLARLSPHYFKQLAIEEIIADVSALARITHPHSYILKFTETKGSEVTCTVYAHDFPGIFSIITGILSATGFNIATGASYTYARKREKKVTRDFRHRQTRPIVHMTETPRKIIDRLSGRLKSGSSSQEWRTRVESLFEKVFSSLPYEYGADIKAARQIVYEAVSQTLAKNPVDSASVLFPLDLSVTQVSAGSTRLTVISEDTPFFLFSLSNGLSLHDISIESIHIKTVGDRIEDELEITDMGGNAVTDEDWISRIKLSVLFTKQFTYFLGRAPDPYSALLRFESIIHDLLELPSAESWNTLLSNPVMLQDLARILGASDFLWEDFIRVQYENILPMLNPSTRTRYLSHESDELEKIIAGRIKAANSSEEKQLLLNEFKNSETYLIDLDHIINEEANFLFLSRKLTALAELVVSTAVELSVEQFASRFGVPTTFAGIEARFAIIGLGKLGGAALGYASDIELLFVYSDSGSTNGKESISNAEYYERVFKNAVNIIEAKQEGIFHIDLRLRPHGKSGPIACSLETFCQYYSPDGPAHSYERLALVRLRAIGGDKDLGAQIERLRDEMIYASESINLRDLKELRAKQFAQKTKHGRKNAKFSPGGLVDLEYSVQIIQCRYGKEHTQLRTPMINVALEKLAQTGLMSSEESESLIEAYHFLRKLINGLRMLRGSAKDLFLPDLDSDEYLHLARRTGYYAKDGLNSAQQLHLEFETRTAVIRNFIDTRLGRDSIPGPPVGNAADLILSESLPDELKKKIFLDGGFRNIERAEANLFSLRGDKNSRQILARLAVLAWDTLRKTPDPDMALNNWERFVESLPDRNTHFRSLLAQPLRMEILLNTFAGSQFLADTLVKTPEFLDWIAQPELIRLVRNKEDINRDLRELSYGPKNDEQWLRDLRKFRKREILRIAIRDICLGVPLQDIVQELSGLADVLVNYALNCLWSESGIKESIEDLGFCILAFGKLGGRELNYSSDIDILAMYRADAPKNQPSGETGEEMLGRLVETLRSHLSDYTEEGFVYRVDLRLRPYGRAGQLVHSDDALFEYYQEKASLWEHQALLKLRPIAGDIESGLGFLERIQPLLCRQRDRSETIESIKKMRDQASGSKSSLKPGIDVKSGEGGIRDIEFLIQGLQLINADRASELLCENTLEALGRLMKRDIIPADTGKKLEDMYLFLRRIEHYLQLIEDRQVHVIPDREEEREALAKRLLGGNSNAREFMESVQNTMLDVRAIYDLFLSSE